jgi:choline dehydrogenase-like flavoprotein
MEIVTEPDIRTAEQARRYAEELQLLLRTIGASDADNDYLTTVLADDFSLRQRAIGVEYQKGERLYRADPRSSAADGERRNVYAAREVILAGGTFNTPQLLMLSGVGPREASRGTRITVVVPLEGVGKNLQDRYARWPSRIE